MTSNIREIFDATEAEEREVSFTALRVWGLLCLLCIVAGGGCSGSNKPRFPSATVQGTVTIDGNLVKEGSIQFVPETRVKGQATQAKIIDGKYKANQVPIGKVRAMFNITRETGKMIKEYSTTYPEVENLVPEKYRSGVELTVSGDENHPFDLTSK